MLNTSDYYGKIWKSNGKVKFCTAEGTHFPLHCAGGQQPDNVACHYRATHMQSSHLQTTAAPVLLWLFHGPCRWMTNAHPPLNGTCAIITTSTTQRHHSSAVLKCYNCTLVTMVSLKQFHNWLSYWVNINRRKIVTVSISSVSPCIRVYPLHLPQ